MALPAIFISNMYVLPCCMKFSKEFNFADFEFFEFHGTNVREFGFQTLLLGIAFRGFHVRYLNVTNTEAVWSFSLHCLQPVSLKFSNVNKRSKFSRNLFWGEFLFKGFNFRESMKNPRNSRKLDPRIISCHTLTRKSYRENDQNVPL